jgi:hypothetical protein
LHRLSYVVPASTRINFSAGSAPQLALFGPAISFLIVLFNIA